MDFIAECIQKLNVQWSKKYDNNLHWKKTCPQIRVSFKYMFTLVENWFTRILMKWNHSKWQVHIVAYGSDKNMKARVDINYIPYTCNT